MEKKIDAKTETQNHQNETKGNQTQEVRKKMNRKTKKAQSNNNKKDTKSPKHEKDDNEETQNETNTENEHGNILFCCTCLYTTYILINSQYILYM